MSDEDRAPLSSTVVGTEPCPKCGSQDNVKVYLDGHRKCWSGGCTYWIPPEGVSQEGREKMGADSHPTSSLPLLTPGSYDAITKRGLQPKVLMAYGYFKTRVGGEDVGVAQFYDQDGHMVAQKVRHPGKVFRWRFSSSSSSALAAVGASAPSAIKVESLKLFGQQVHGERFDKRVVVCTGELDALSVAQAVDLKCAVVSVNGGDSTAVKNLQANWRWLDRFEEIILFFDDDESGRKAREECARLFAVGKVKIATLNGCKDASDALQQGRQKELSECLWAATTWRPRGIVNAADCASDVLDDAVATRGYDWPWDCLNKNTLGVQPGGVTYLVAGTGIGKTTALFEIEYALWRQGAHLGIMGFEDMRRDIQLGLMGVHLSRRLGINPLSRPEMAKAHGEVFGDRRIHLFDPETAEWSFKAIFDYARFMVKALDCDVVVIDPLSFVAAGLGASDDERRALDAASRDFSAFAKELGCHFLIAHHLKRIEGRAHEEGAVTSIGQLRGSGGIANFATLVVGFERNQQPSVDETTGEIEDEGPTNVRLLKNRKVGTTGLMGSLQYDKETGRLTETLALKAANDNRRRGKRPTPAAHQESDF